MPDVNSQIVDSVASVVTLTSGAAPSQSFGMLDTVMAEAFGMAMYNAVNRQQSASMISSAAVTAACARMLGGPLGPICVPPDPAPPAPCPPVPPGVQPLPPVPHLAPAQVIASAAAGAELAVDAIRQAESYYDAAAAAARESLQEIAADASAAPPPPPAPPPPSPTPEVVKRRDAVPPETTTVAPDPCPPPLKLDPPCPPPPDPPCP